MNRSGRRAVGAIRAAIGVFAIAAHASGQVPEAHVAVECPSLDAEHRAALEARAKSGLIVRQAVGGLVFECRGTEALVSWTKADSEMAREGVILPPDSNAAVETLLEVAERLFTRAPETSPSASGSDGAPPVPPPEGPPPPEPPPPAPPETPETPETSPPPPESPRSGRYRLPLAFSAGGVGEYWAPVAALGPTVNAGWHALESLRIDAGGTLLFSTEERLRVSGRLLRVHAGAGFRAGERVRLGARALVDSMSADPEPGLGVPGASDVSFGLRLHAAYAVPLASGFSLLAAPFASLRAAPVRVELGNREAFRIPVVTGGVEFLLEWDAR